MINFYSFYNKKGLDKEHYGQLIELLHDHLYVKELEQIKPIIKSSPRYAYRYALYVMGSRWEEAEPYIMKDPRAAANYATDVIKERWVGAEPIIKNSFWWDDYCWEFGL
jgi:hypothetical protein